MVINVQETEKNCPMNNLYQEAEELVFNKHPAQYKIDIQLDRVTNKNSRLLQQHMEAIESEANRIEKYLETLTKPASTTKPTATTSKDLHSNLPPNPIDQAVPHGIDLDWN